MVCDWFKNLAPLSQQIRSKTKTIMTYLHAFSRPWRRLNVFSWNSNWFIGLSTSVVTGQSIITLALVLRRSIENRSMSTNTHMRALAKDHEKSIEKILFHLMIERSSTS